MIIVRNTLALLLISISLFSCKKNKEPEPVTFSGRVTDAISGSAVSGVTVKIKMQKAASNGIYNPGFNTVATTTTDASGNYTVTFTPEDPISYKIEISRDLFFAKEVPITNDEVPPGSNKVTNISMDPLGWFRVNIKNVSPINSSDNILFQNTSEGNGCSSCCNNLAVNFGGTNVDTFLICQRIANPNITFSWIVTKNGNTNQFSNSVTAISGDTVVYNLNY